MIRCDHPLLLIYRGLLGGIVFAVDEFVKGFNGKLLILHNRDAGAIDSIILPVAVDRNPEFRDQGIGRFQVIHDTGGHDFSGQLHDCAGVDVGNRVGDKV